MEFNAEKDEHDDFFRANLINRNLRFFDELPPKNVVGTNVVRSNCPTSDNCD